MSTDQSPLQLLVLVLAPTLAHDEFILSSDQLVLDFIILFRFTFTSHINFANNQLLSPVTPNTQFVNAARFSSTGHPRSPCCQSPEIAFPQSSAKGTPEIAARGPFRPTPGLFVVTRVLLKTYLRCGRRRRAFFKTVTGTC
ncbi:hypothetical protein BD626DRAFT_588543 [Schizophyllum amplum]|uniref:Secreted protein n=1 Tax=Schizophyllum amplum TaxID=97359 RepID=A0A550BSA1_9AGAR|nr:hypothetical protein BD626DRAFT_588543 [Auriculariopsis ampla]